MMSKVEARKKVSGDSGNRRLLDEIEAISKALYLDKNPSANSISRSSSRSKSVSAAHFPESKSKPKIGADDPSQKEKKSIWNWRPLKAFSHIRNRRFNCCFTLQVHTVEGLPSNFEDLSLCVHWKRRDGSLVTRPAKVCQGTTEFEENLMHTCSVYGSRSGPHHSAKYEAKHFLLYVAPFDAPECDFGKHRVDLTRLLPLTLEELEEDKNSGKWTTSFRLTGKANGAVLNVSFGYLVIADNATAPGNKQSIPNALKLRENDLKPVPKFGKLDGRNSIQRSGSLPVLTAQHSYASSSCVEDIKDLHEIFPISRSELASSVDILYQKFDEEKSICSSEDNPKNGAFAGDHELIKPAPHNLPDCNKDASENENEVNDFSVVEQGIEFSSQEHVTPEDVLIKTTDFAVVESHEEAVASIANALPHVASQVGSDGFVECASELSIRDCASEEDHLSSKESLMKELESALESVASLEVAALDSPDDQDESDYKIAQKGKSLSFDAVTESVVSEFCNMLGIEDNTFGVSESESESPRERLLRQFEKEALADGYSLFDFGASDGDLTEGGYDATYVAGWENVSTSFEHSSPVQDIEEEQQVKNHVRSKTKAKVLEDLETEALMQEWGLNEQAFQASPRSSAGGFDSPVHLPPEEPLELPPLADGLGPYLQTKNGGFLRSMNPSLFRNAKSGGSLVMQASSPVVVPAEMGSDTMEILQSLAAVGMEKLSMQANKLMPLEDITGKTMNQVATEALPSLEEIDRQHILQHDLEFEQDVVFAQKKGKGRSSGSRSSKCAPSSTGNEIGSEYVSLEDLAPLALDKVEALSMEGLRIQSGMSDEEAPSNISAQSIGEISTLQGKGVNISGTLGLDGTAGLQLLDIKESSDDVDGLMGLSLSLNEWMKLDSGEIDDDDDQISERTTKILAAHHANSLNWIRGKGERKRGKGSSRKCGLMGNNFTVALMVQLRDPLRNYEPVGAPMLALIQVERVFVPPKPTIFRKVSQVTTNYDDDAEVLKSTRKEVVKEEEDQKLPEQEAVQQFKITEVHVAGLKTDQGKKKLWGSKAQQQSGSRWLLANGMGKSNKHPFLKSKPVSKSTDTATMKVQPGDTLWSISARVHGDGSKWKELAALNPHIRNPNIILANETIRLC